MLVDEASGALSVDGGISRVGELILALNYEFAPNDSIQALWRTANEDVRPGLVGVEELGGDYIVRAAGTSEATNRRLQVQRAEKVLALVLADPTSTPGQVYAARLSLLNAIGEREPEKYLGNEQEFEARIQAAREQEAARAREAEERELLTKIGGQSGGQGPDLREGAEQAMAGAMRG